MSQPADATERSNLNSGVVVAAWVIWALILMSSLVYLLLMFMLHPTPREDGNSPVMVGTLAVVALFCVALAVGARLGGRALVRKDPSNLGRALGWLALALVSWSLAESVSIYGLILHMLAEARITAMSFWGFGLIALIGLAPWRAQKA